MPEKPAPMISTSLWSVTCYLLRGLDRIDLDPPEHHRLVDAVEPVVDGVQHVVVPHVPRPVGARFGQHMSGALYVAGVDVPRRFLGHRLFGGMGERTECATETL